MLLAFFALFSWTVFGIICRAIAQSRGLSPNHWFFIGFFFGLFAIPFVCFWRTPEKAAPPAPAPPPQLSRAHWYYLNEEHKQLGPLSLDAMRRAFRDNRLTSSTYIWTDDLPDWTPLHKHDSLNTHLTDT